VIKSHYPTHLILGEEATGSGSSASASALSDYLALASESGEHLWIVDPIDGTTNFVHNIPMSMPSVACVSPEGEVVAGCIYDAERGECFVASKGGGAWMNGERIEVCKNTKELSECVLAMGSPPAKESMEMSLKGIEVIMPKVRTIRMLGSAAVMLAWVAAGR
jgi:myo-inositol-1(or 4)-monophosphatase